MSTLIENDDQGFDVLNKIIEELSKDNLQGFPIQTVESKNKKSVLIKNFNFNGKNMLEEFGSFAVSGITADKSFFMAAESKAAAAGQKNGERLYIFAKRNIAGTYKLFVEIDQDTKNHSSLFFKFFKNSPFDKAEYEKLMDKIKFIPANQPLLCIFSLHGFSDYVKENAKNCKLISIEEMYC